jgi:hypothetical protein
MKRNINLFVLGFEILAIVILHAVKINHNDQPARQPENNSSLTSNASLVRQASTPPLLSIK